MVQLQQDDYGNVLPLYQAEGGCFPLILSVIQQKQNGWIFVDDAKKPSFALILTKFGFVYLVGAKADDDFDDAVVHFLEIPKDHLPSYLLWYSPSLRWQKKLNKLPASLIRYRERIRFQFDRHNADYLGAELRCPPGFEIKLLDSDLLTVASKFGVGIDSKFWASADDFLTNGVGVCILKDGEILSLCYSACIVDGLAEVDVITLPEHRGRGLSRIVSQRFIMECLQRNVIPTWDCFANNEASVRLAQSLGFVKLHDYSFYTFNVPIALTDN